MASGGATSSEEDTNRFKMVLVGETGTGKTSFIEFLLNYAAQYKNRENFDAIKVSSFVKRSVMQRRPWESDTVHSKKYTAVMGDFILDVIDTPGFNDTKSVESKEYEKKNVRNIINAIKEERYVNCICLVMNGSVCRLTEAMIKVLRQIVSILPPDVKSNIIILFTKIRDDLSFKIDLDMLKGYHLSVDKEMTFLIDNPFVRLETANKKDSRVMKRLKHDFEDAHNTLEDMFEVIRTLKPAVTNNFGLFHDSVEEIEHSFMEIGASYHNKAELEKVISTMESETLNEITLERLQVVKSKHKNLVCLSCRSNCHLNCGCWFTLFSLKACKQIEGGVCTSCNHSHHDHSRTKQYYETVSIKLRLPDLRNLARREKYKKDLADCNSVIEQQVYQMKENLKKFQSLGSNFFFTQNAIVEVEKMKKRVKKIPGFEFDATILDTTLQVFRNPITAKHTEIKFRWACGILGLDTDNVKEEDIARVREDQAEYHSDKATVLVKINHAADYLKETISRK